MAPMNDQTERQLNDRPPDVDLPSPETTEDEYDIDACRRLYTSIIEMAVHDYRFLQKMQCRDDTSRYDRKKQRQMTEDGDPREFFASSWFEEVCDYVGVTPVLIRERLSREDEEVGLYQVA